MIKFSVITVCLNAGNDLIATVKSTLAQTYSDFEIIVKDGFSEDGSIEQLPQDRRIRLVQEKDNGIYDAMNQGIAAAEGDYLIFMNAGDKFYNNTVLENISAGICQKKSSLYYGRCYNALLNVVDPAPQKITKFFCYRSMICHQATIYSSEILKVRGYDCAYHVSADKERLLYAVIKEHIECVYLPVIVVSFQDGGFCSSDKAKALLIDEKHKMLQHYFTLSEHMLYSIIYTLTLPALRKSILQSAKIAKIYRKIISVFYGNTSN